MILPSLSFSKLVVVFRYVDKKWASKATVQPMPVAGQKAYSPERSVGVSRSGIPKKARKYSLEEEAFSNNMPHIASTTRARGVTLIVC